MRIIREFFDKAGNLDARMVSIEGTSYLMYNNCDDMLEVEYSDGELRFTGIGKSVNIEYLSGDKGILVLTKGIRQILMGISKEFDIPFAMLKYLYSLEWVGR